MADPWALLWCSKFGAGSSRWPKKAVLASSSDENDGEEVFPMDMLAIPKGCYHWVLAEFNKAALSRNFG